MITCLVPGAAIAIPQVTLPYRWIRTPPVPLPMMTLDPRSSKALVSLLKDYFSIEMDFSKLNEEIKEMESVFESFKKQADQFMKPPQEDRGADSYFR